MKFTKEIDRFVVQDMDGKSYPIVCIQESAGERGDEVSGHQRFQTDSGRQVNQDEKDLDVFYLPFGIATPWISARRKR
jgi:hypothetical protein